MAGAAGYRGRYAAGAMLLKTGDSGRLENDADGGGPGGTAGQEPARVIPKAGCVRGLDPRPGTRREQPGRHDDLRRPQCGTVRPDELQARFPPWGCRRLESEAQGQAGHTMRIGTWPVVRPRATGGVEQAEVLAVPPLAGLASPAGRDGPLHRRGEHRVELVVVIVDVITSSPRCPEYRTRRPRAARPIPPPSFPCGGRPDR